MLDRRVYVDLLKTDDEGRLLTTATATKMDLASLRIVPVDGLAVRVHTDDADASGSQDHLIGNGVFRFNAALDDWVIELDRASLRHRSELR